MSVLRLRLAGPLQSWGSRSRFVRRATEAAPTKSGILGLLAAAKGLRRQEPIEDLLDLRLAVRIDQPGVLLRDFQTARHLVSNIAMPLSERYYWSDAVFTAFIEGRDEVVEGLGEALRDPAYPLYLGRRSCVPEGRLMLGVTDDALSDVISNTPWQASKRHQRKKKAEGMVSLDVQADLGVFEGLVARRQQQDVPISFDPERRQYAVREVVDTTVRIVNPEFVESVGEPAHDPMGLAGEFA